MLKQKLAKLSAHMQPPENVSRRTLGDIGEEHAVKYLKKQGFEVLERNWRCRAGEIDIICLHGSELVFVEVKTRRAGKNASQYLFDSISAKKQQRLRLLSEIYLAGPGRLLNISAVRIDALGVLLNPKTLKAEEIRHIVAAI